ncbi:hypothetical protein JW916_12225 [Candidatus Sumerlaeota bacterium]|nr:hypothetical protein [Candidatus Sumerlaeota bacterium]
MSDSNPLETNRAERIPRRRLFGRLLGFCAGVVVLPGALSRRASAEEPRPIPSPTEREASHYRPLFERGRNIAG